MIYQECLGQSELKSLTNFDLPASEWSICCCFRFQVCRKPVVHHRELTLHSSNIQKCCWDKYGLIQNPFPIYKLHKEEQKRGNAQQQIV